MTPPETSFKPVVEALKNPAFTAVLSAVWNNGPISRSDLARSIDLAPSSVTRITRLLKKAHLIRELQVGPSTGGRPPMLLTLNEEAGHVVGIDLSGVRLRGAVMTPSGQAITALEHPFESIGEEKVQAQVERLVSELLANKAVKGRRILALGVSVPGTVDQVAGTIVAVTNLRLHNHGLGTILQKRFNLPVFLEHDTAAAAYAEKDNGAGRGLNNLIFITISNGIGAGLIMDNRIFRGEGGGAGELGHIVVERDGPLCLCGKRGCLEAVASVPAIVAEAQDALAQGSDTLMEELSHSAPEGLSIEVIVRAAELGDSVAREIVCKAADYLALAIGAVTCVLDIRTVIVGGEVVSSGDYFLDLLRKALPKYQLYSNPAQIIPAQLGQDAAIWGVSKLALRYVLNLQHT